MAGEMADWGQTAQIVGDALHKKVSVLQTFSVAVGWRSNEQILYKKHCNFV